MTLSEKISDFFMELATFSYERLELLKHAKNKTAPIAAKLARQEQTRAEGFYCFFDSIDSCDLGILVSELREAQAFLQQDTLMDGLAVEFINTPVHGNQSNKSTALLATVNALLETPELVNIEPSSVRPAWKGNREKKMSAAILCYAFNQVAEKQTKRLEKLSKIDDIGDSSEEEIESLLESNRRNRANIKG